MRAKSQTARIPHGNCDKCGKAIAKGDRYWSARPRYGAKKIRCDDVACRFKPSDLTNSKLSAVYAAQEDGYEALRTATCIQDLKDALSNVAEGTRAVAEEYRESSSQWAGGNGHPEWDEWADQIEAAADELDTAAEEMPDDPDDSEADESSDDDTEEGGEGEEGPDLDALREQADEAIGNMELP